MQQVPQPIMGNRLPGSGYGRRYAALGIGEHRMVESELADAGGNLRDLLGRVCPRVAPLGIKRVSGQDWISNGDAEPL